MAENIISEILIFIIIIGGFIVGITNIIDAFKSVHQRRFTDSIWVKWLYSFIGFYLCIVYSILEFTILTNKYLFTSTYIRPSMAILVVLLLVGRQRPVYLPDVVRGIINKIKEKGGKNNGKY